MMLTVDEARKYFSYDSTSGLVTRKINSLRNVAKAGTVVGCVANLNGKNYLVVSIRGTRYLVHRVIWLIVTGVFPKDDIDHENGNGTDNRWTNLKAVTHLENGRNQRKYSNNTSGHAGVYWYKKGHCWRAMIKYRGKLIYLGYFKNKLDAIKCRKKAEIKYSFHDNHGTTRPL